MISQTLHNENPLRLAKLDGIRLVDNTTSPEVLSSKCQTLEHWKKKAKTICDDSRICSFPDEQAVPNACTIQSSHYTRSSKIAISQMCSVSEHINRPGLGLGSLQKHTAMAPAMISLVLSLPPLCYWYLGYWTITRRNGE